MDNNLKLPEKPSEEAMKMLEGVTEEELLELEEITPLLSMDEPLF